MQNGVFAKKTPLYNNHVNLDGRIVDFAGWMLPVQYSSIIKEHLHTRSLNSVFDICHMGEFLIEGDNAEADLDMILTTNVRGMPDMRCRYGFILNEYGGIIDDTILYRLSADKFMLVVNASRTDCDFEWLNDRKSQTTTVKNISSATAKIDLQGPLSPSTAVKVFNEPSLSALKKFTFTEFDYSGIPVLISATGYTGESGFEIFVPADSAAEIWDLLLNGDSVKPAGLGARDSLRLEKGFSLYGHDINEEINPFEANLGRFISFEKDFTGRKSVEKFLSEHSSNLLVPFICDGRRAARDGYRIFSGENDIGYVTSGVYSPVLKRGIGLCFIDANYSEAGTDIQCVSDDIRINAVIAELPFV